MEQQFQSCLDKQDNIKKIFSTCLNEETRYQKIIELGRSIPRMDPQYKKPENLVKGCQSIMYLHAWKEGNRVRFSIDSDALISSGLAAILLSVYDGESPEVILKCPPKYLEELGINASLTPGRANGLYSIHLRMKQEALKFLVQGTKNPPS